MSFIRLCVFFIFPPRIDLIFFVNFFIPHIALIHGDVVKTAAKTYSYVGGTNKRVMKVF